MRWVCVVCLSLVSGFTQSADHRIPLNVVVTDKSGKPVAGLQQQDFELLDNRKPQRILSFRAVDGAKSDAPVEVLLVVDAVNNPFTKVAFARDQIEKFLRRDGGNLSRPVSLAFLTGSGTTFGNSSSWLFRTA